jgi:hypothetical protein
MTTATRCDVIGLELPAVDIGMAAFALDGCNLEISARDTQRRILRFVARRAGSGLMCPKQWEGSFGVIEVRKLFPGLRRMASLAPSEPSRGTCPRQLIELPAMGIAVARGAGKRPPAVHRHLLRHELRRRPVALVARHGHMRSAERKESVFVFLQREC